MSDVASPSGQGDLTKVVDLALGRGLSGFLGKTSAIAWIYRAWQLCTNAEEFDEKRQLQTLTDLTNEEWDFGDNATASAESFAYFMDEEDILSVDEDFVEPFQLPKDEVAILLTETYFQFTRGMSYLVDRAQFLKKLSTYIGQDTSKSSFSDRVFLMKANMLWSFSAKWLELILPSCFQDVEPHHNYYARARALGLDHRVPFDHPNLDMIESSGVLAMYLLMNGSISK